MLPIMSSHHKLAQALADLERNSEQSKAVRATGHCVVIAGPGSGKTKTLTTAMALSLKDIQDPRGVACITYNNECAIELEDRLSNLGIKRNDQNFIGTIHSFALAKIIVPYVKFFPELSLNSFRVISQSESDAVKGETYQSLNFGTNSRYDWRRANAKRMRVVDRETREWREQEPELSDLIEAYEKKLRQGGLIDFDDMPLIAFRMAKKFEWIRDALKAQFPVLFVDEYQDFGYALHELVQLLCFETGIRLFAVGDADQSIYGFAGANPKLLENLANRNDVDDIRLRTNYRSGSDIIRASLIALGETRDYRSQDGIPPGDIKFIPIAGDLDSQAAYISSHIIPNLYKQYPNCEIAVLYRDKILGDKLSSMLKKDGVVHTRSDQNSLIKRGSRIGRFVEGCAQWVTGGWRTVDPSFSKLVQQAVGLVYADHTDDGERQMISSTLADFLFTTDDPDGNAHAWLQRFNHKVFSSWKKVARNHLTDWDEVCRLISLTDPACDNDIPLSVFSGRMDLGRSVSIGTFHSSKGSEFDIVIFYATNGDVFPNRYEKSDESVREARRLFYVGITRPRKKLIITYQENNPSPWIDELR